MGRRASVRLGVAVATALAVVAGCGIGAVGLLDGPSSATNGADAAGESDGARSEDAPSGEDGATTCVADLAIDPRNCGACGHDCAGGTCTAGRCSPIAFVTEASGQVVRAVTANETHVYWSSSTASTIQRIGVDGAARAEVVSAGATQLAIDDGYLYFTGGGLRRMNLATLEQQTIAPGVSACIGLDPDGVHLYGVGAGDTIVGLLRDGGDQGMVVGASDGVAKPWGVAATATHWYWSQGLHLEPDGSVFRRARPSGPTTAVHLHQANPNCLLFGDDGLLYWPNADQGSIHRSAPDGSSYETLATGQDTPTQVAMNGKFLYWNNGNKVMRLAR